MSAPSSCKFAMSAYHRQLHDEMRHVCDISSRQVENAVYVPWVLPMRWLRFARCFAT